LPGGNLLFWFLFNHNPFYKLDWKTQSSPC